QGCLPRRQRPQDGDLNELPSAQPGPCRATGGALVFWRLGLQFPLNGCGGCRTTSVPGARTKNTGDDACLHQGPSTPQRSLYWTPAFAGMTVMKRSIMS